MGKWGFSPSISQELAPEVMWFPSYTIVHKRVVGRDIETGVMMDSIVVPQSCSEITPDF